jgi:DNA-binding response OmpR family regulator
MRILVVEDEPVLAAALVEVLEDESYAVDLAPDGETASELMDVNEYDAVVLDWSIPPPTGIELLRRWRGRGVTTPVLMLTGRGGVEDRVGGLDTGADDYLTKPFSFDELLARVRSLLRRREKALATDLAAGDVSMDRAGHRVTVGGEAIELSPKEFALLEYFLYHPDQVVTRTDLSEHVWDDSFDSLSNVIDVTVHRLRKKIDGSRSDRLLHTIKGVGYMLKSDRC